MDDECLGGESCGMSQHLPEIDAAAAERARLRQLALSRWENEGGAALASIPADEPRQTNAEADQLRIRVISLESLVIACWSTPTNISASVSATWPTSSRRGPGTRRTR